MEKAVDIKLKPSEAAQAERIEAAAIAAAQIPHNRVTAVRTLRRSIDARGRNPVVRLRVAVFADQEPAAEPAMLSQLQPVHDRPSVLIIGAGPAGYFAALELIELGLRPVIFDRGKDVRARRRDLRAIQQFGEVNPHSNYCFGEGGAGTYSDGKLYTRSHKRGNIEKVLRLLVEHGAQSDILIDAHPHIGSNKLPKVVANIRETILHYGGEIFFEHLLTDFLWEDGHLKGVVINGEQAYRSSAVILATGHSSRDVYDLLYRSGIRLEAKPFALGVRIEHPQALIDEIQYGQRPREPDLPASSYKLVTQVDGCGVYSFCMCPGGLVVPAATAPGEIVLNGMSMSRRDSAFANSGTVVAVTEEDLLPFRQHGVFAGLAFQRSVERAMFAFGEGGQQAPAQRLPDFVKGKLSADLPTSSYIPGLLTAPLHELLPHLVYQRLQRAVQDFGRKMKGYYTSEANVIATESRTSAPLRIPRDPHTFMHPETAGLFPAGEGGGYAGGIVSAAMDGQKVARAVKHFVLAG